MTDVLRKHSTTFLSAVDQPVGNDSLEGSYRHKTTISSPEISDLSAKFQQVHGSISRNAKILHVLKHSHAKNGLS